VTPPRPGLVVAVERADRHRAVTRLAWAAGAGLAALGLPPVDVHGPLHYAGIMDPLCGLTRSMRYSFRGDLSAAWRYNPLGPPLALLTAAAAARGVLGTATGHWAALRLTVPRPVRRAGWVLAIAGAGALQARAQSIAALLTARR
jgi:hypothetical protein